MLCPVCGWTNVMKRKQGRMLLSYPPQQVYEYRCAKCDHRWEGAEQVKGSEYPWEPANSPVERVRLMRHKLRQ